MARLHPALARAARKPLIWLVALALLVYGQSSSIVQMLGPTHRHAVVTQPGTTAWLDGVEAAFADIRAWRDRLHARLLPAEEMHAHPYAGAGSFAHGDASDPHVHDAAAGQHTHTHTHFHSVFQRHHHDPHDPSVVTLDGNGPDTLADAGAQASVGSATLTLGLATAMTVPSPTASLLAWTRHTPATWADALPKLLERPPRA